MNKIEREIKRRLFEFKNKSSFNGVTMVLLCFPAEAKKSIEKGIIEPYNKEIPRVLNWYNLTDKGVKYFKNK